MNEHERINYVEFPAKDLEAGKKFFTSVFGWLFTDYGPDYTAFLSYKQFFKALFFLFPLIIII